ncbi:hypothetical protein M3Y94_01082500 [Aphelenchoides besseyi]|nr:hypothetical protein M3Y94_01082500 [Aphelenchoides besseyi]
MVRTQDGKDGLLFYLCPADTRPFTFCCQITAKCSVCEELESPKTRPLKALENVLSHQNDGQGKLQKTNSTKLISVLEKKCKTLESKTKELEQELNRQIELAKKSKTKYGGVYDEVFILQKKLTYAQMELQNQEFFKSKAQEFEDDCNNWKLKAQELERQLNERIEMVKISNANPFKPEDIDLLWTMRKEAQLTDFCLLVNDQRIEVHKPIIALKSHFFSNYFNAEPTNSEYAINDLSFEVVNKMIEFVYQGNIDNFEDYASDLYVAAWKFEVSSLKKKCVEFLKSRIAKENVADVLVLAAQHDDEDLIAFTIQFADDNGGRSQLFLMIAIHQLLQSNFSLYVKIAEILRF